MPQAMYSVTITRPVDQVFAYLADGATSTRWRPGVIDIDRTSGDGGVGTRYAQTVKGPMNRAVSADYEITAFEPSQRLEFQTVSGPVRPHGRYDLVQVLGGTQLTFALDVQLGGLQGLLMGSMVQKTMDAEVHTLDKLKQVLEASDLDPS